MKKYIVTIKIKEGINSHTKNLFPLCFLLKYTLVWQPVLLYPVTVRLTQWGSKALGDQGMTAIQILRNFYGNSIYINSANEVAGVPSSWPGANLSIGSRGDSVRQMQEQLNAIAGVYSSVPTVAADGVYGPQTEAAVRAFQETFGLPANGIVDLPTWYRISGIYVAVTRIGELG